MKIAELDPRIQALVPCYGDLVPGVPAGDANIYLETFNDALELVENSLGCRLEDFQRLGCRSQAPEDKFCYNRDFYVWWKLKKTAPRMDSKKAFQLFDEWRTLQDFKSVPNDRETDRLMARADQVFDRRVSVLIELISELTFKLIPIQPVTSGDTAAATAISEILEIRRKVTIYEELTLPPARLFQPEGWAQTLSLMKDTIEVTQKEPRKVDKYRREGAEFVLVKSTKREYLRLSQKWPLKKCVDLFRRIKGYKHGDTATEYAAALTYLGMWCDLDILLRQAFLGDAASTTEPEFLTLYLRQWRGKLTTNETYRLLESFNRDAFDRLRSNCALWPCDPVADHLWQILTPDFKLIFPSKNCLRRCIVDLVHTWITLYNQGIMP